MRTLTPLMIFEHLWPAGTGLLFTALFVSAQRNGWIVPDLTTALSTLTNVGAIAIGFLATAKSILLSIKDSNRTLIGMQTNPALYAKLMRFIQKAIHWCFLSVLFSALALFISKMGAGPFYDGLMIVVVFTGATAGGACFRTVRHFFLILNSKG